jgi:hypothetical protein
MRVVLLLILRLATGVIEDLTASRHPTVSAHDVFAVPLQEGCRSAASVNSWRGKFRNVTALPRIRQERTLTPGSTHWIDEGRCGDAAPDYVREKEAIANLADRMVNQPSELVPQSRPGIV